MAAWNKGTLDQMFSMIQGRPTLCDNGKQRLLSHISNVCPQSKRLQFHFLNEKIRLLPVCAYVELDPLTCMQ